MMKAELKTKLKNVRNSCKELHYSIKNHEKQLKYCNRCNAFTEVSANDLCGCCGIHYPKQNPNWEILKRIMNKFLKKYEPLVLAWMEFPTERPVYLKIKHGAWKYELDIYYVALFLEVRNMDRKPFPTPDNWDGKNCEWQNDYSKLDSKKQRQYEKYDKYDTTFRLISSQLFWL